jgi:hypothetical protein
VETQAMDELVLRAYERLGFVVTRRERMRDGRTKFHISCDFEQSRRAARQPT